MTPGEIYEVAGEGVGHLEICPACKSSTLLHVSTHSGFLYAVHKIAPGYSLN